MQIVIDLPEDVIKEAKTNPNYYPLYIFEKVWIWKAIKKGTPLPKHHGRLIDADRLRSMYSINRANFNTVVGIQKWVDNAPTIIEAYKEVQEWR